MPKIFIDNMKGVSTYVRVSVKKVFGLCKCKYKSIIYNTWYLVIININQGLVSSDAMFYFIGDSWESVVDPFNYNTDMDISALADAVAREEWSKEFWERVRG